MKTKFTEKNWQQMIKWCEKEMKKHKEPPHGYTMIEDDQGRLIIYTPDATTAKRIKLAVATADIYKRK